MFNSASRSLLAATLAVAVFVPSASASSGKTLKQTYTDLRVEVVKKHGVDTAGRNIRRQGIKTNHGSRPASNRELARSVRTFRRWLAPPVVAAMPGDSTGSVPAYAGGAYPIPRAIVMCESGGDYSALNPSSGAGGAFQVLPSTWKYMGGTGSPHTASPAEQDRIAAKIWRVQGRSAWVC